MSKERANNGITKSNSDINFIKPFNDCICQNNYNTAANCIKRFIIAFTFRHMSEVASNSTFIVCVNGTSYEFSRTSSKLLCPIT